MSEIKMAPCGLNCAQCDMYIATKADSNEMRDAVAKKWSELFHYQFTIEDINCDGCLSDGRKGIYCGTMCEIRPCAIKKGITICESCKDYVCDILQKNRKESEQYTE